jgi:hypothetical protein
MRNAWAAYDGNEGAMQRISFGPDVIKVAPPTIDAWKALERVLEAFGYDIRIEDTDSYNNRQIKGGGGKSLHAYGIALDINWHTNPYRDHAGKRAERFSAKPTQAERAEDVRLGLADTDMTKQMTDAVLAINTLGGKRVFGWGGAWETLKDSMHFQIEVTPTGRRMPSARPPRPMWTAFTTLKLNHSRPRGSTWVFLARSSTTTLGVPCSGGPSASRLSTTWR